MRVNQDLIQNVISFLSELVENQYYRHDWSEEIEELNRILGTNKESEFVFYIIDPDSRKIVSNYVLRVYQDFSILNTNSTQILFDSEKQARDFLYSFLPRESVYEREVPIC